MSEMLIVSSKIKKYVQTKAQFNTSKEFLDALSKSVEGICNEAIDKARAEKRKTVKARDLS